MSAGVSSEFSACGHHGESSMLSGDLNAAVVDVMAEVVGDRTLNEIITVGRQEIEDPVKHRLQTLCDE